MPKESNNEINKLLLKSIRDENVEQINYCLQNGANINHHDDVPIAAAASINNIKIVELLINNDADVNQRNPYSALAQAAIFQTNILMVKFLLSHGADASGYMFGGSVLSHTCINIHSDDNGEDTYIPIDDISYEIAKVLLNAGASPDGKRGDQLPPPIEMPITANDMRTVKLLLDSKAKLTTSPVLAAANYCASKGYYDILKLLIAYGWKPNPKKSKDNLPASPLNYAIANGHIDIVKLLLENKIKLNYVPNFRPQSTYLQFYYSYHPVTLAIKSGEHDILKYLLKNGACPDGDLKQTTQAEEIPPIVMASCQNDIKAVEILLGYDFKINAYKDFLYGEFDCSGMTALDVALENNNNEMIDIILKNGGKKRQTHNN